MKLFQSSFEKGEHQIRNIPLAFRPYTMGICLLRKIPHDSKIVLNLDYIAVEIWQPEEFYDDRYGIVLSFGDHGNYLGENLDFPIDVLRNLSSIKTITKALHDKISRELTSAYEKCPRGQQKLCLFSDICSWNEAIRILNSG